MGTTSRPVPPGTGLRRVRVRPIRPDDEQRLTDFHAHLSAETIRRRFFNAHPVLSPKELDRFTHVDGDVRVAVVAVEDDEIVGVGRYESIPGTDDVEVAFVVRDDHQGRGLGSELVRHIAEEAARHGKRRMLAETLLDNLPMLRAFAHLPGMTRRMVDGIWEVEVPLHRDDEIDP
jgi:GNAT superfamily N-acetyltransferase